jgi:flavodoxin
MKIAVRYQSRGGNTKVVAEAIAKAAGVQAQPIDSPITEPVDLLIVGGGVYAWDIDKSLRAYLEGLSPETAKSVAAFTTAGGMNKAGTIASIVQARGIRVREETLPVKVMLRNHAALGGKGKFTLSDKENDAITGFVRKLVG